MRVSLQVIAKSALVMLSGAASAATDDFDDNVKNPRNWFANDGSSGNGAFLEANSQLEYVCPGGTAIDSAARFWIQTRQNVDTTWSVQIDVTNTYSPAGGTDFVSYGLSVENPSGPGQVFIYLTQSPGLANGYIAQLYNNGGTAAFQVATPPQALNAGAIRISYNPATKVFSTEYDSNGAAGGYSWTLLARFGIAGSGGADGNGNWGMPATGFFGVKVLCVSANTAVPFGTAFGDNFTISGDPDIIVLGKNREIANNDRKPSRRDGSDFGALRKKRKDTHRFTVQNRGTDPLNFVAPRARLKGSGKNRRAFKLKGKPTAGLASRRFKVIRVLFKPKSRGRYRTWLMIFSLDPDEPIFRFRIGGKSRR